MRIGLDRNVLAPYAALHPTFHTGFQFVPDGNSLTGYRCVDRPHSRAYGDGFQYISLHVAFSLYPDVAHSEVILLPGQEDAYQMLARSELVWV